MAYTNLYFFSQSKNVNVFKCDKLKRNLKIFHCLDIRQQCIDIELTIFSLTFLYCNYAERKIPFIK